MSTIKDKGLVLREVFVGESDKLLTVLTKEHGKITVSARGARKPKSKYAAASQPFSYCEFVLYEGKGFYSIAQAELIESFYSIRNDLTRLCYGSFFMEIVEKMILQDMPVKKIMRLLLKALQMLTRSDFSPDLTAIIYEFKFLQIEGFSPTVNSCVLCGETVETQKYFSGEGVICKSCLKDYQGQKVKISDTAVYVINYILTSDFEELFNFAVSDEVLLELKKCVKIFRENNIDIYFKSLELLM